jgi:hypothetical protein
MKRYIVLKARWCEPGEIDIQFCSEHDGIEPALLACETNQDEEGNHVLDTIENVGYGDIDISPRRDYNHYQKAKSR